MSTNKLSFHEVAFAAENYRVRQNADDGILPGKGGVM